MKIIHTSDWHIGQNFFHYDRKDEHRNFSRQLCSIVEREQPDVLLVAGDIFDVMIPSKSAQRLFVKIMVDLHKRKPDMTIVVIAGNHDSASLIELHDVLWIEQNVKIIGSIQRKTDLSIDFERHILPISNQNGMLLGHVIAVPYVNNNYFPNVDTELHSNKMQAFHQRLIDLTREKGASLPIVMTGHLATVGCDYEGHKEEILKLSYVDISNFGTGYDYLALGHIHKPQKVKGCANDNAYYSGSPIPISFDETYTHSVNVVEVSSGAKPVVRKEKIEQSHKLYTIPRKEGGNCIEVLQAIESIPNEFAYVRIMLSVTDIVPLVDKETIEHAFEGKKYKLCEIHPVRKSSPLNSKFFFESAEELRSLNPLFIAREYYKKTHGGENLNPELEKLLNEVLDNVSRQI